MKGTIPIKSINMEGTPPLTGRALPNLINAVSILKSKSKSTCLSRRSQNKRGFDFNILTAFIRLGRAGPAGAGCPSYYYFYYYFKVERLYILVFIFKHYVIAGPDIIGQVLQS